jgi:hypothetical protein
MESQQDRRLGLEDLEGIEKIDRNKSNWPKKNRRMSHSTPTYSNPLWLLSYS